MAEEFEPLVERGDSRLFPVERKPLLGEQPLDFGERRLGAGAVFGQNNEIVGEAYDASAAGGERFIEPVEIEIGQQGRYIGLP